MDSPPFLSVVIPAFNAEHTLSRAVNSVLHDKSLRVEVIIVNDGSTDATREVAQEISLTDNRVITLNQINRGVSSARNAGLKAAKGDYISFLDADDVVLPGALKSVLGTLANGSPDCLRVGYIGGPAKRDKKRDNTTIGPGLYSEVSEKGRLLSALMSGDLFGYPWLLFISQRIGKLVSFRADIAYMEDLLFTLDVVKLARSFEIVNQPVVHYLVNDHGATRNPKYVLRNLKATIAVEDEVYKLLYGMHLSTSELHRISSRRLNGLGVLFVSSSRASSFDRDEFWSISARLHASPGVMGLASFLTRPDMRLPWVLPVFLVSKGQVRLAFWCSRSLSTLRRVKSSLRRFTGATIEKGQRRGL